VKPGLRLCGAVAVVLASVALADAAAAERVWFQTTDNVRLAAAVYVPMRTPAPAVVLVHMLGRSGADWAFTAERLREAGLLVVAPDLRGHGESNGSFDSASDLTPLLKDVTAAIAFVKTRPGMLPGHLGLAGASLGANLVIQAASADPAVISVAALSPSLDYRGVRCEAAMRKYGDRPMLLLASTDDPYAMRSSRQLADIGARAQMETAESAGHGTIMLTRAPDLVGRLVDWFRNTLL
jgi:alpha-beta hydrolase superfamily lysophospholipase